MPQRALPGTYVIVIEDDERIRFALEQALRARGYGVGTAADGRSGHRLVESRRPDVILLDLGLPDIDGIDLLLELRTLCAVPIIVTTARDQDADIIRALETGADDYLVKPFSVDHLQARIRAALRRTQPGVAKHVTIGELHVDPSTRTATLRGEQIDLSRKEFDLLAYLALHHERVVSKRELLGAIWGLPWGGSDKTVDVHISWLRRKLGESAGAPRYIQAVRGIGLRLVEPSR
jgi:DNA-binding response OmpR family regulator